MLIKGELTIDELNLIDAMPLDQFIPPRFLNITTENRYVKNIFSYPVISTDSRLIRNTHDFVQRCVAGENLGEAVLSEAAVTFVEHRAQHFFRGGVCADERGG